MLPMLLPPLLGEPLLLRLIDGVGKLPDVQLVLGRLSLVHAHLRGERLQLLRLLPQARLCTNIADKFNRSARRRYVVSYEVDGSGGSAHCMCRPYIRQHMFIPTMRSKV